MEKRGKSPGLWKARIVYFRSCGAQQARNSKMLTKATEGSTSQLTVVGSGDEVVVVVVVLEVVVVVVVVVDFLRSENGFLVI